MTTGRHPLSDTDKDGAEDKKITVTMALNYWLNLNSRTPSFRFGHGHIFNNVFENNNLGIDTRDSLCPSTQFK